jgi:hypothetical protein
MLVPRQAIDDQEFGTPQTEHRQSGFGILTGNGIAGGVVERYCREGRVAEVAAYCETDVVNTYRVRLRYELFRGRLTESGLQASEANLGDYIPWHSNTKPPLAYVEEEKALEPSTGVTYLHQRHPRR